MPWQPWHSLMCWSLWVIIVRKWLEPVSSDIESRRTESSAWVMNPTPSCPHQTDAFFFFFISTKVCCTFLRLLHMFIISFLLSLLACAAANTVDVPLSPDEARLPSQPEALGAVGNDPRQHCNLLGEEAIKVWVHVVGQLSVNNPFHTEMTKKREEVRLCVCSEKQNVFTCFSRTKMGLISQIFQTNVHTWCCAAWFWKPPWICRLCSCFLLSWNYVCELKALLGVRKTPQMPVCVPILILPYTSENTKCYFCT